MDGVRGGNEGGSHTKTLAYQTSDHTVEMHDMIIGEFILLRPPNKKPDQAKA